MGISHLVLDEADHMLDLGFFEPIKKIVRELPKDRQTRLFSATMPLQIEQLGQYSLLTLSGSRHHRQASQPTRSPSMSL